MSHLTCSKVIIKDLEILKKAVSNFGGLVWKEGQKEFKWYYKGATSEQIVNGFGKCDHAIAFVNPEKYTAYGYEIGVVRNKNGEGWSLVFDPYDYQAAKKVGNGCENLSTAYSQEFIRDFAEKNGFMIQESIGEDGHINLELTSHI